MVEAGKGEGRGEEWSGSIANSTLKSNKCSKMPQCPHASTDKTQLKSDKEGKLMKMILQKISALLLLASWGILYLSAAASTHSYEMLLIWCVTHIFPEASRCSLASLWHNDSAVFHHMHWVTDKTQTNNNNNNMRTHSAATCKHTPAVSVTALVTHLPVDPLGQSCWACLWLWR